MLHVLSQYGLPGEDTEIYNTPLVSGSNALRVETTVKGRRALQNPALPRLPYFDRDTFLLAFNNGPGKTRRLLSTPENTHVPRIPVCRTSGVQCWLCETDMKPDDRERARKRRMLSESEAAAFETALQINPSGTVTVTGNERDACIISRSMYFCADCSGVFLCRVRRWIM